MNHRQAIQESGLKSARASAYEALQTSKVEVTPQTIILAELIAESAFRIGIETQSDALQPEFAALNGAREVAWAV